MGGEINRIGHGGQTLHEAVYDLYFVRLLLDWHLKSEGNVTLSKSDANFNKLVERQHLIFHTTEIPLGLKV